MKVYTGPRPTLDTAAVQASLTQYRGLITAEAREIVLSKIGKGMGDSSVCIMCDAFKVPRATVHTFRAFNAITRGLEAQGLIRQGEIPAVLSEEGVTLFGARRGWVLA